MQEILKDKLFFLATYMLISIGIISWVMQTDKRRVFRALMEIM